MLCDPPRPPDSYKTRSSEYERPFSVHDLAPNRPLQPLYNPPTPPPEDDEAEAMDWTPSQPSLPPASSYRPSKPTRVEPSPFYGRLPQTPKSQAHKLRNPNQPTFRKASSAQKQNFFKRPHRKSDQDEASELGSDSESVSTAISRHEVASPQFAPPRFFPGTDFLQDTGLESIFSQTFSIAEEPYKYSIAHGSQEQSNRKPIPNPITQRLSLLLLSLSTMAWWHASKIPGLVTFLRFASLGILAMVAGRGLIQSIQRNEEHWSWVDTLLYASELCFATFLGSAVKMQSMDYRLRFLGLGLFGAMVLQQFWIMILTMSNASRGRPSPLPTPDDSQTQTPKATAHSPPSKSSAAAHIRPSRRSTTTSSALSTRSQHQSSPRASVSDRTTRSSKFRAVNSPSSSSFSGLSLG